jgi:hypothetical protein
LRNADACAQNPAKHHLDESQSAVQFVRQERFDRRRPHEYAKYNCEEEDQEEDDEIPPAQKDLEVRIVEVVVAKPNCIDNPKYVVWRINFSKRAFFIAY